MNKSDLIDALSTKENLSSENASEIVNLIFDGFTKTLWHLLGCDQGDPETGFDQAFFQAVLEERQADRH